MEKLNVLLLGSGGREHAIAWKLSQSPKLGSLFIAPGNPGTAEHGENVALSLSDFDGILRFIEEKNIHLTIVGPEQPLVDGISDFLESHGHLVFGPSKAAAQLEGSKEFAKIIMDKYDVPTAAFRTFTKNERIHAFAYIMSHPEERLVVKADGLAAGKGVFVCQTREEAKSAFDELCNNPGFSEASSKIVIEDFMEGEEVSVFVISDGRRYSIAGYAQDHKRIGDGDTGPNTGGMGAYSPTPLIDLQKEREIEVKIVRPMIAGMAHEEIPYKGVLYCGLMMTKSGPKVVEFNCRFGDPECQVLMPRIINDILEVFHEVASEHLVQHLTLSEDFCSTVVLVSEGYPGDYEKGKEISIPNEKNHLFFHAGTKLEGGKLKSNGGRVINAIGLKSSLQASLDQAYKTAEAVSFEGKYFRKDIGQKGLARIKE